VELGHKGRVVEDLGPGGVLGELALIDPAPRSLTAMATTPARVVRVDEEQFNYLVHEHPMFALQVMTAMAERLRRSRPLAAAPGSRYVCGMESLKVPVLALRADDRIKVGLERYERVTRIDDREPGVVKVIVASGTVHRFRYRDIATVSA
jgi:CRP-like cAMP-binding protein